MIYTVTFNPAIDYIVHIPKMQVGCVNRSGNEEIYFGGKGINVSFVLNELGIKSKALGFVAGFTGDAIVKGVTERGIEADFIHLEKGFSRNLGCVCSTRPATNTKTKCDRALRTITMGKPAKRNPLVVPKATKIAMGRERKRAKKMGTWLPKV